MCISYYFQVRKHTLQIHNASIKQTKMKTKKYTITKKIAKHGSQSIIVVPRVLETQLKPGTIAEITIEILEEK